MKQAALAFAILVAPFGAAAAAVFGSIIVDGRVPGREMPIELVCGNDVIDRKLVDASGSYRFTNVPARTNCVVRIEGATAPVVLFPNPTKFDYALTHPAGRAVLVQR